MPTPPEPDPPTQAVLTRVLDALRGVRFGHVVVTVHEGRVVQIERTEKLRLSSSGERC